MAGVSANDAVAWHPGVNPFQEALRTVSQLCGAGTVIYDTEGFTTRAARSPIDPLWSGHRSAFCELICDSARIQRPFGQPRAGLLTYSAVVKSDFWFWACPVPNTNIYG